MDVETYITGNPPKADKPDHECGRAGLGFGSINDFWIYLLAMGVFYSCARPDPASATLSTTDSTNHKIPTYKPKLYEN
jgi:hypothetical protein